MMVRDIVVVVMVVVEMKDRTTFDRRGTTCLVHLPQLEYYIYIVAFLKKSSVEYYLRRNLVVHGLCGHRLTCILTQRRAQI